MKIIDRIARRLGYIKKRGFDAAQISRLTASWSVASPSADAEIMRALPALRARSRDLVLNNDYAKKFSQMCVTHIAGPQGFALQMQVPETLNNGKLLDDDANNAIENAFAKWAKRGVCEVSTRMSFTMLQHSVIRAVMRDGEALIRRVRGYANPFRYALQLVDIDRLDTERNQNDLPGGARIRMGVEMDAFGRPLAYHLKTAHPGEHAYAAATGIYERVPADQMWHLYIAERPEQTRGVPWMHAAMMRLHNLGGFEEAAVIAARVGASKMGFFETPDGVADSLATDIDADGALYTSAEPGEFGVLPPGYKFQEYSPDYPHANYEAFVKACLRGVASGFGVSYNTLSNDLVGVSYSSIRTAVLEERDNWMCLQNWLVDAWLAELFEEWLQLALVAGQIRLPNGSPLPSQRFEKFNTARWRGRRWQWVDPEKDINASIKAIEMGLKSRRQVVTDQGGDLEDTFTELAQEKLLAEKNGLDFSTEKSTPAQGGNGQEPKQQPEDAATEDKDADAVS